MKTMQDLDAKLRARIDEMLERPQMYGTQLSVEMQVLLCVELLAAAKWPEYTDKQQQEMFRKPLREVLTKEFGSWQTPISSHSLSMADFVDTLKRLRDAYYDLIKTGLDFSTQENDEG